jgi:hypothetical protein
LTTGERGTGTLHRPRLTIAEIRSRVRRAGGWYSAVTLVACAHCAGRQVRWHTRKVHRACHTAREESWNRERKRRAHAAGDGLEA